MMVRYSIIDQTNDTKTTKKGRDDKMYFIFIIITIKRALLKYYYFNVVCYSGRTRYIPAYIIRICLPTAGDFRNRSMTARVE